MVTVHFTCSRQVDVAQKIMKRWITLLVLLTLLLTGCKASPQAAAPNIDKGSYLTGHTLSETAAGEWDTGFHLLPAADNEPQGILFKCMTDGNAIQPVIRSLDGQTVWEGDPCRGTYNYNVVVDSLPAGEYALWIVWDGPVSGTLDFYIVPGEAVQLPKASPLALLGGVGMTLVALGYFIYAASRRMGWKYLALGALGWTVSVFLKFMVAIPANGPIYAVLVGQTRGGIGEWAFDLWVGLLTGIFEVLFIWLVLRRTRWGKASWKQALAFGIGFGAFEALVLGLYATGPTLLALLWPSLLPAEAITALAQSNNPLWGLAPVSERFFVVLVHIFSNVLVFHAIAAHKPGSMWIAFIYKTLIDSLAAYAQLVGLDTLTKVWTVEAIIAVWGVLGWLGTLRVSRIYPQQPETTSIPQPESVSPE